MPTSDKESNQEGNMKRFCVAAVVSTLVVLFSIPIYAHHSGAGVDRTKTVVVEGVVKSFKWGNPHSWLEVEVANKKGGSDVWNWEMNPPSWLVRNGWKSTSVKAGDKVTVTGRPFMNGDPGGIFVSVTLAGGQILGAGLNPSGPPPQAPRQ
jgi:hypothetical protein